MRLTSALAALLGRAEGTELPEDDLLGWLRAAGLITYPSPLLVGLLEELPEVLAAEVLPRLGRTDLAMFARVGPASRAVVMASGLPRAGATVGVPLKLSRGFCRSVERLAWAKANDCPWIATVCARNGSLQVLRRARELDCPWDKRTCAHGRCGRAPECVKVGAGARLPVGGGHWGHWGRRHGLLHTRRAIRAPEGDEVPPGAGLPVERVDECGPPLMAGN